MWVVTATVLVARAGESERRGVRLRVAGPDDGRWPRRSRVGLRTRDRRRDARDDDHAVVLRARATC
jgi:hypothetical protein